MKLLNIVFTHGRMASGSQRPARLDQANAARGSQVGQSPEPASSADHSVGRRTALAKLAGFAAMSLPSWSWAQEKFPSRTIRIIVPFPPGSAIDIVARVVAESLGKKYSQGVVVENRAGASGLVGMQYASKAAPDGYTLVAGGLGSNVLPPATFRNLPLDIVNSFTPLVQVAEFPNVMVVRADHPVSSMQEFIKYAKSKSKGAITAGSNDVGSSPYMSMALFSLRTGINMTYVPYRGPNEVLTDLLSGSLEVGLSSLPSYTQMIRNGRIKALAVTSTYRAKELPNVPTMQETGVPDYDVSSWISMHAVPGIPEEITSQLSRDILEGLAIPEYRAKLEAVGFTVNPLGKEEFAKKSTAELARWKDIAARAGVSVDYKNRGG
jgi:tripartite-type tricarboxylate transporter receptor subunit TctC